MKKRTLVFVVAAAACCAALIGGTLAYFTDSDKDVNVMVSGNVDIVQNETDRNGNEFGLEPVGFFPAVYSADGLSYDATFTALDGNTYKIWDQSLENEVDKVISITNKGSMDAYVRTIVLMENTADNALCEKIHGLWNNSDGQYREWVTDANGAEVQVTIDGVLYSIAVCQYETALPAGETSAPSLQQLFLDPSATNDWFALLGDGKVNIIALSQAAQTVGFADAETALNTAFGEVTAENVVKWVAETGMETPGA